MTTAQLRTLRFVAASLLLVLAACAQGPQGVEETTAAEIEALPDDCDGLLARGARVLAVGALQGDTRYLLDTTEGRCKGSEATVIDTLRRREARALADKLADKVGRHADPNPHPDLGGNPTASNPNPHPDLVAKPATNGSPGDDHADPTPHPDVEDDSAESGDDDDVVIIIIWIIVEEDPVGNPDPSSASAGEEPPRDDGEAVSQVPDP